MIPCQRVRILFVVALLTLVAWPAAAYQILLDIDTDQDPATINDYTEETEVEVWVILAPTTAGEQIGAGGFGLGGSCLECDGVQNYGTWFELYIGQDWVAASGFSGRVDGILLLGCPAETGFHTILYFEPEGGGTVTLDQPMFLGHFRAGVRTPDEGCPRVPSNLAAMSIQGELWNYLQIGGPAVDVESCSWGQIKAVYR